MIELSVSLASNGVVKVPGYEQLVRFGYTKNRGVYRLAVTASGEWEGLAIRCFWHVPDGKYPVSSLVVDGYVAVPASVTAQPGNGCITFEGSDGTKTVTSAALRYRVSANSGTEDGTPTPDAPVPIVSAGDSGTIVVTLSDGKGKTQTLTLPTPNGLPGIPVTSGGNYTDSTGHQWICDEVDLERGVKVQRIKTGVIGSITKSPTAKEGFVQLSIWLGSISLGVGMGANAPTAFCNRALNVNQLEEYNPDFVTICTYGHKESVQIRFNAPTALYATSEEFSAALMGATYSYAIATPIETPLTPDEIAAYKALTAYGPDTVVQAGDGAGIKLDYQRDVNIAIKKLEDAVASMT